MVLANGWVTKQVDYTNAFAQATLNEKVYIEQPKGFARKDEHNLVLKLIKSVYRLKQAPKSFLMKFLVDSERGDLFSLNLIHVYV